MGRRMDCAGTSSPSGLRWTALAVGDAVMAHLVPSAPRGRRPDGALVASRRSVVPIPDGVTPEQAATLPMNALTAISGLEPLGLTRARRSP